MPALDTSATVAWINRAFAVVSQNADRLTELDAAIGDGDHGANLTRGMQAAVDALNENPPESPGKALITAGRAVVSKTGGASGPLYGTGLRRAGKSLDGATSSDAQGAADANDDGSSALADALQAMLDAITELGGASESDKTMIDALAPAARAAYDATGNGATPAEVAAAAATAADAGRAATIPLQARKGRASYLGERSIGHEDPGAASMALIIRALADTLKE
jgi:dihydroxyacetone kinase-like protein